MQFSRLFLLTATFLLFSAGAAITCTLWGSTGCLNQTGNVTIIAKNRDWKPNHTQILRIVSPADGYDYLGLYATGDDEPGLKAGINRKGLVILSASAGSIPREERQRVQGKRGVMKGILSTYSSVDEVISDQNIFSEARPSFLMLADQNSIISVEIGLNGRFVLTRQDNGNISHTNHYVSPDLLMDNQKIGESSRKRMKKIEELLASRSSCFSLADYIRISEDQSDGPKNSILRTGVHPGDERTLATWIASIPQNGSPLVYIKLRNPGEADKVISYRLDSNFWERKELLQ